MRRYLPLLVVAAVVALSIGAASIVLHTDLLRSAIEGAAARRLVIVMDGFITGAAALAAVRMVPAVVGYLVASHRSVEPGHAVVLDALGTRPLLDLELRLGEGSGAALALPLLDAATRILRDMASFASAGVSDRG